jgi:hypothetical protein
MKLDSHPCIIRRSEWLANILNSLYDRCGLDIGALQDNDPIYVHTRDDFKIIRPQSANRYGNTFGFTLSISIAKGKSAYIIVINQSLCNEFNLSTNEVAAVILHELGHIYNNPNSQDNGSSDGIEKVKSEIWADCFTAKFGFRNDLISTLYKSIQSDKFKDSKNELIKRIEELLTGDLQYVGGKYEPAKVF